MAERLTLPPWRAPNALAPLQGRGMPDLALTALTVAIVYSTASISGRVLDATGGAIAGATVTAANAGTQVANQTETDAEGVYVLLWMPPGRYRFVIKRPGFQAFTVERDVEVRAREALTLNFRMRGAWSSGC